MIGALINLIIYLLILGLLYGVADYVIKQFIPDPPARIIRVVLLVVLAIAAILLLLDLIGAGGGSFPRLVPQ